jgi:polyisoprenoid-binding protein YceI
MVVPIGGGTTLRVGGATFAVGEGTVTIRSDTRAAVDVVADTATFTSGIAMRDAHVKSADFLDASRHPTRGSSA